MNMRDMKEIDEAVKAMKFDVDETANQLMALEMTIVEQFDVSKSIKIQFFFKKKRGEKILDCISYNITIL